MRVFFFSFHIVPNASMEPTIIPGEKIVSSKISYKSIEDVNRGDVIVFKSPKDPSILYVKRVIGIPEDKIRIDDNRVYINDIPLEKRRILVEKFYSYLSQIDSDHLVFEEKIGNTTHLILESPPGEKSSTRFFPPQKRTYYKVPQGTLFVIGDHRNNSTDSRAWGPVPFENIQGKALMIIWGRNSQDLSHFFGKSKFFRKIK